MKISKQENKFAFTLISYAYGEANRFDRNFSKMEYALQEGKLHIERVVSDLNIPFWEEGNIIESLEEGIKEALEKDLENFTWQANDDEPRWNAFRIIKTPIKGVYPPVEY